MIIHFFKESNTGEWPTSDSIIQTWREAQYLPRREEIVYLSELHEHYIVGSVIHGQFCVYIGVY
jgi:hypothetical protein